MRGLLVTTDTTDYCPRRLVEEARAIGVGLDAVSYQDIEIDLNKKRVELGTEKGFLDKVDVVYLRKPRNSKFGNYNYDFLREFLINYLRLDGIKVRILNGEFLTNFVHKHDKLNQTLRLQMAGLPIIDTYYSNSFSLLKKLRKSNWPMVFKPVDRSLGWGVVSYNSITEVKAPKNKMSNHDYIITRKLPNKGDFRVLVLGNKVIGAIKRTAPPGEFVTNMAVGGKGIRVKVTKEMKHLAVKAAEVFKLEFAGVDLMKDEQGSIRILEVNESPVFQGFEKATGINVAGKIVEYLIRGK